MAEKPNSVFVIYILTTPQKTWEALTNGDFTEQYFFGRRMESDQIDALGDVVRLTVSEFHPKGIDEKYAEGGRRGWPIILSGLKSLLETGRSLPKFELPDMPTG